MPNIQHSQCRNLQDYAPSYMWRIRCLTAPSGVSVPNDFNLRCRSSTVPKREANQMAEITVHAQKRRLPGVEHTSGQITLTCTETIDNTIRRLLNDMREVNRANETSHALTFKDAASSWELIQMDRGGRDIASWTLIECFVEDEDAGSEFTDGESTTYFVDYQITLSYSHFTKKFLA